MLEITIPAMELFDESTNEFINVKETTLRLEHSLVSISKWESKWEKPFVSRNEKSIEETIDYIRCMTLTQNVNPDIYKSIPGDCINKVNQYINAPMTATTFRDEKKKAANREVITSELIYYWMIAFNIPMECQKWHLNRLLTLIRICDIKSGSGKKMSKNEILSQNRELNAARRKLHGTRG